MKLLFIIFLLAGVCQLGFCQIPSDARIFFDEGLKEYKEGNYKLADSLFSEAIQKYKWPEAYFNKASANIQLGNLKEYCINLKLAGDLGDKEYQAKYKSRCTTSETIYRDSNNIFCNKEQASFYEITTKDPYSFILTYTKYVGDSEIFSMVINKRDTAIIKCEEMVLPEFKGGEEKMLKFLVDNVQYPSYSRSNNISGIIFAVFVVTDEGKITDITIQKGEMIDLSHEVIRVIRKMPEWNPGTCGGKPINMQMVLPIRFLLK